MRLLVPRASSIPCDNTIGLIASTRLDNIARIAPDTMTFLKPEK
jgi:hypothetical protein